MYLLHVHMFMVINACFVCVCVKRLIDPSLLDGGGARRQSLIRTQLMGPNGHVSKD